METIGVVLKVTGGTDFISTLNKASTAIDKVYTTAAKGGASFSVLNSTMNSAATVIHSVAGATGILTAAQTKAALQASDAKNKHSDLNTVLKETGTAAGSAASGVDKAGSAVKSSADKTKTAADKSGDLHSAFKKIADIGGNVAGKLGDIGAAAGGALVSGFKSAADSVLGFAGNLTDTLGGLAGKAADMGVDFIKTSVTVAGDFDSAMRVIQATSDMSAGDLKKLSDLAIDLGVQFPVSTTDVANGFGELTKAGFNANQVLAAGPGLIRLGVAANLDNAKSAEILAGSIRGFGLQAEDANKVVDILAQTANASSVDITDLGQTFKYAAPAAKAMGFSLEDVSFVTGILGNNMIKGSTAGTGLAAIFSRLAAPPKEAAEAINALGLKITDTSGKVRPLRDITEELRAKFAGLSQVEQLDLAKKIAGQDAAKSLLSIVNASTEDWNSMKNAIDHAGGSAEKMAGIMSGGTKGALDNMAGSVEALQIKIGTALAPAVVFATGKIADFIAVAARGFDEIMMGLNGKEYQQGGEKMTTPFIEFGKTLRQTVVPAVKQVADFFLNTVLPVAGQIAMVLLTQVIPAVIKFATEAGQFLAPIIANVANFVTTKLIPGVIQFAQQAAPIVVSAIDNIGKFFSTVLLPAVGEVVNFWNTVLIPGFQTAAAWISANLIPVFISIGNTFTNTVLPAMSTFGNFVVSDVLPKLQSFADWFGSNVMPVIGQFVAFVADPLIPTIGKIAAVILDTVIPTITNWVGVIATFLTPVFNALVGFISGTVIPVMGNIASFIGGTVVPAFVTIGQFINANVMPVLGTLAGFLGGALTAAFTNIGTVVGGVWEFIKNAISTAWGIIQGVFDIITGVLSGNFAGAWTGIQKVVSSVWTGISNFIGETWHTISGVFDNITGVLGGPFKAAWDAIKTAIETVWTGIVAAVQSGKSLLDPIFDGISMAVGAVGKVWDSLVDTIKKGVGVVGAVAKGDWSGAWDIMTGKATEGATKTISEIDKIASNIAGKDFSASASKAGATIGTGLAAGINGQAQAVAAAAANIAQQAINAAKAKLNSQSPSKVFIQVGQDVGAGFKIGIDQSAGGVVDAVGNVIGQVIDEPGRNLVEFRNEVGKFIEPIREMNPVINNIIGSKNDPAVPLFILLQTLEQITDDSGNRFETKIGALVGKLAGLKTGIDDAAPKIKQSLTDLTGTMGKVIDDAPPAVEDKLKPIPEAVEKTGDDIKEAGGKAADSMTAAMNLITSAAAAAGAVLISSLNSILAQVQTVVAAIANGSVVTNNTNPAGNTPAGGNETGSRSPSPGAPGNSAPSTGVLLPSYALGGVHKGGPALIADRGPEAVIDPFGGMFIALRPSVVDLAAGSIILDAGETRDFIASGGGRANAQATPGQIYSTINNNNRSTTNNYSLSLNNSMESSGVMADYDLMKMLA